MSAWQPEVLGLMVAALDSPTARWPAIRAPLGALLAHTHERVRRFGSHQFQLNLADDRTLPGYFMNLRDVRADHCLQWEFGEGAA